VYLRDVSDETLSQEHGFSKGYSLVTEVTECQSKRRDVMWKTYKCKQT